MNGNFNPKEDGGGGRGVRFLGWKSREKQFWSKMSHFGENLQVEYSSFRVRTLDGHQINYSWSYNFPLLHGLLIYIYFEGGMVFLSMIFITNLDNSKHFYFVQQKTNPLPHPPSQTD